MANNQLTYTLPSFYHRHRKKTSIIYLSVLLFLVVVGVALPLLRVDVSSQSRGVVRSLQENVPLSATISGRVLVNNLERNNQAIYKGDTLLIVETPVLEIQQNLKANLRSDYYAQMQDLNTLISGNTSSVLRTAVYQKQLGQYLQRVAELKVAVEQAKRNFSRTEDLYNQGVTPQIEYDQSLFELESANEALNSYRRQQANTWQAEKRQLEVETMNLSSEIQQITQQKENYVLTAPISGILVNYTGLQKESFLNAQQSIGEISPMDKLLVECYVSPEDIGLIQVGQNVNFQIDAYNYNQWGMVSGKVTEIDENITLQQDGTAFFKVRCEMNQNYLELDNHYKGEITKGMTLTGRFIINRRSLWQLLYDEIDDWLNPNQMEIEE